MMTTHGIAAATAQTPDGILDGVLVRLGELGARLGLALAVFLVLMLVGRLLRPLVKARLNRYRRPSYTRVFTGVFSLVVGVFAFLLALTAAFPSVEVVDVLASLGIISVAVGFAFKNVLENLLAGVLLLLRDPFKSGDEIAVAGYEGTVEGITVRETLLRTSDGRRVLLPNATVYINPLEVTTHYSATRSSFEVEIDPAADLGEARRIAVEALATVPATQGHAPPDVVTVGWTGGVLRLECRLWSDPDRGTRTAAIDDAVAAVRAAFVNEGVLLPEQLVVVQMRDPVGPAKVQ